MNQRIIASKKTLDEVKQILMQEEVLDEVRDERIRQDEKWGIQNHASPFVWLAIVGEELGEVNEAALKAEFEEPHWRREWMLRYRKELIEVAASAVAAVECLDRNGI